MASHTRTAGSRSRLQTRVCAATFAAMALVLAASADHAAAQSTGAISGFVRNADVGTPLVSAGVSVYDAGGNLVGSVATNSSGAYTKTGLPAGTYYLRTSMGSGSDYVDEVYDDIPCPGWYCPPPTTGTGVVVTAGSTTAGVNFGLTLRGSIAGTVSNAGTGHSVSGITVSVFAANGAFAGSAVTNASGYYTTTGFPTGVYFLRTSNSLAYNDELYDNIPCPGGACAVTSGTGVGVMSGMTTRGVDFALTLRATITGTVTDAATGAPLAGVSVQAVTADYQTAGSATTNAQGAYLITGLQTGTFYVYTSGSGQLDEAYDNVPDPWHFASRRWEWTGVSVISGATTGGIDFGLRPGGTITGTVRSLLTGGTLSSVTVHLFSAAGAYFSEATTTGSGTYTLRGLPTGTYFVAALGNSMHVAEIFDDVTFWGEDTVTSGTGVNVTVGSVTSGIDFWLAVGGSISGNVWNAATGVPLAGVRVSAWHEGREVDSGLTDAAGRYAVPYLPTGTYSVRTENDSWYVDEVYDNQPCAGDLCAAMPGTGVGVVVGAATRGIDFGLATGGTIAGTVAVEGSGTPLGSVEVRVYDASGAFLKSAYSAADTGAYAVTGLPAGTYYVRTSNTAGYADELYGNIPCPGGACTLTEGTGVSVTAGVTASGIDFGLAVGGTIAGTVKDVANGTALTSRYVEVFDAAGRLVGSTYVDGAGAYSKTGLATGTYYVRTSRSPWYDASDYEDELYDGVPCPGGACLVTAGTGVAVTAGATTPGIGFELTRLGSMSGAVTDAVTGAPIRSVRVDVFDADGSLACSATTSTAGAYATAGLPAGSYFVRTADTWGYAGELYSGLPCAGGTCAVTSGTPVSVATGSVTAGIDFGLRQMGGGGGDFTGDRKSDVLWHHATLGELWLWPMAGAVRLSETYVRTIADTTWEIRGQGDQDGDGDADLLWRNRVTGQIYFWPMDGATWLDEIHVDTVDPAYDIVGTGDFDGDGKSDILWRHLTQGDVWIWLMDGATPKSRVYVDRVDPGYVVKGVGDFDGNGKADIVWHHGTTGEVWVWPMSGTTRLAETRVATVPDTGYQIQGVADFTGDGKADLVWWHVTSGEVWIWTMDGTTRTAETWVATVPETDYRIVGTGDHDGDGKADLLWHHAVRGEVWVWLMDGTTRRSETWVATVPDTGYRVVR